MLPQVPWILIVYILTLALLSGLLVFCFVRYRKLLTKKTSKDLELQRQDYEDRLLNEIHERYGYSVDKVKIFNTIIDSISSMAPYSVASYAIVGRKRLRFRHHLYDNVSRDYLEEVKNLLLDSVGGSISSIALKSHMEETITGNFVDNSKRSRPVSSIEVPVLLNDSPVGVLAITSKAGNYYSTEQEQLIVKAINRVFTEVGRLQQLIDKEKTKLEMMVENMNSGVVVIDEEFNIVTINTALASILDFDERSNISIFEIVSLLAPNFSLDSVINEAISNNKTTTHKEVQVGSKYLDIVVLPIAGEIDKKGAGILIEDVTQEHNFDQMRADFTSMLVHELRSPLTIIMDSADLMVRERKRLNVEQLDMLLNQIKDSSKGLLDIVNDLLDTAKIEAGKMKIKKEPNDINNLLIEEVSSFYNLAKGQNVRISVDTDMSIGQIPFDYEKIKQVMNNLLSNAIKFTEKGTIKVSSQFNGKNVEISVADSGVGIPDTEKQKLFDKYSQVSKTVSADQKGTGLGLVISKGIVEGHGGKIWVEDNSPQGAVFIFTLPV